MKLEYPQYENGMYKLGKADFDDIAYEILDEYLPDALNSPKVVDINYLIKDCLYLNVFSKNITVDKSVLGLIAFENATLPCYDLAFNRTQMDLQAGDIVIDLSLSGKQMKYNLLSCPKFRHVDFRVLIPAVEENSGTSGIATTTGDMSYC